MTRTANKFIVVLVFVGVVLGLVIVLPAQQVNGRILGAIADASGAAIANAEISIVNQDTGAVRNVVSGPDGLYSAPQIPAGNYSLMVSAQGFGRKQIKDVIVNVASDSRIDLSLEVGSVTESVVVNESLPLVDITSSSVGGTVNQREVADLPLNGRNWTDLTLMQPGVTQAKIYSGNAVLPGASGDIYSSNGGSLRSNFYSLDGANMSTLTGYNSSSITNSSLGIDGIKEYKVVTSMFSAEYGMKMGSQTTIVSKGGTNQFHGDAFEYLRNSALDARNYFDALDTANINGLGTDKSPVYPGKRIPPFRRNDFGGSFGGPIRKDQTFFYGVYEGIRQKLGVTTTTKTLPAGCYVNGTVPSVIANNNCIAGSATAPITISPAILPLARLFPAPNVTGAPTFNYTFPYQQPTSEDYGQMRVDQNFSAADSFFIRYTQDDSRTYVAQTYPNYFNALDSQSYLATLSESHILSPTLLNTARFSYSRTNGAIDAVVQPASLNAPNVVFVPGNPVGIGNINPGSGVTALGTACCPTAAAQDIFTLSDDVFWTKGKHSFKFGTLINRFQLYPNAHNFFQGTVSFPSLTSFFAGSYSLITVEQPGSQTSFSLRNHTFGFYGQDDYRVFPRLTLNLGLRYEFTTVPAERNPARASVVRSPLDNAGTPGPMFLNNSLHNFSPRIGFAWDVRGDGKTSIKGGAGIYYDLQSFTAIPLVNAISNPPISANFQLSNTLATPAIPFTVPITIAANVPLSPREPEFNLPQPTMAQYNLTVQRQLPWQTAITVSYVGSRSWHLFQIREGNGVKPVGTDANGLPIYGCFTPPSANPSIAQTFVMPGSNGACPSTNTAIGPRANPTWGSYQHNLARGDSYYNSLQMQLNKRITQGMQFQFSYTWAKLLDGGQGEFSSESVTELNQFPEGVSQKFDRGPATFDVAQNVRANVIYHAPNFKSDGILSKAANGWWFSSIVGAQSGYPITPTLASDRALAGSPSYQFLRPNLGPTFNRDTVIKGTVSQWFDPTMFSLPVAGTYGNEGRGILRGPGFVSVDFSIVKDTKLGVLGEQGSLQFRAETFNILNHANFSLPAAGLWSSGAPATVPAGPIGTTAIPALATVGQITSTVNNSRQIQFALKLIF